MLVANYMIKSRLSLLIAITIAITVAINITVAIIIITNTVQFHSLCLVFAASVAEPEMHYCAVQPERR